jgi:hypothetical protein
MYTLKSHDVSMHFVAFYVLTYHVRACIQILMQTRSNKNVLVHHTYAHTKHMHTFTGYCGPGWTRTRARCVDTRRHTSAPRHGISQERLCTNRGWRWGSLDRCYRGRFGEERPASYNKDEDIWGNCQGRHFVPCDYNSWGVCVCVCVCVWKSVCVLHGKKVTNECLRRRECSYIHAAKVTCMHFQCNDVAAAVNSNAPVNVQANLHACVGTCTHNAQERVAHLRPYLHIHIHLLEFFSLLHACTVVYARLQHFRGNKEIFMNNIICVKKHTPSNQTKGLLSCTWNEFVHVCIHEILTRCSRRTRSSWKQHHCRQKRTWLSARCVSRVLCKRMQTEISFPATLFVISLAVLEIDSRHRIPAQPNS